MKAQPELAKYALSPMQELVCLLGPDAVHDAFNVKERRLLRRCVRLWATPLRRLPDLPAPRRNPGFGRWTGQWPLPPGPWRTCLSIGGRGSGKSTTAANWILDWAERLPGEELAVIAPTKGDLFGTCVEHPHTGILAWERPHFKLDYQPSKFRIECPNGARIRLLSGEKPERLRVANNIAKAWIEELGAMNRAQKVWDVLEGSVRAGKLPQMLFTTNPSKGLALINELAISPMSAVVQSNGLQNPNLPEAFFVSTLLPALSDPRKARELVYGEQLDDDPEALFHREWFHHISHAEVEHIRFRRIGIGLDPAETGNVNADDSGIIGGGVTEDGLGVLMADATATTPQGQPKPSPRVVARRAVELYWRIGASFIVVDVVRNGATYEGLLLGAAKEMALEKNEPRLAGVKVVRKGGNNTKEALAFPVASQLYEPGRIKHVPGLDALEAQMCSWTPDAKWSPDRMDAACSLLSELMLTKPAAPLIFRSV